MSLSKFFFYKISCYVIDIKACLCPLPKVLQLFSKDHSEPFFSVEFQFTQTRTNNWLLCQLKKMLNNRDDVFLWRGPKKNGIYSFMLFT